MPSHTPKERSKRKSTANKVVKKSNKSKSTKSKPKSKGRR